MRIVHVYYKLKAWRDEQLKNENNLRIKAYYAVAPHWSGKMPLRHLWQLWRIPEIDGEFDKMNIYANIREQTPEEKEWFNKMKNLK